MGATDLRTGGQERRHRGQSDNAEINHQAPSLLPELPLSEDDSWVNRYVPLLGTASILSFRTAWGALLPGGCRLRPHRGLCGQSDVRFWGAANTHWTAGMGRIATVPRQEPERPYAIQGHSPAGMGHAQSFDHVGV